MNNDFSPLTQTWFSPFKLALISCLFLIGQLKPLMAQTDAQIRKIEWKGNHFVTSSELSNHMNTKTKTNTQRMIPWSKWPRYSSHVLQEDVVRIKKYYQRIGYLSPEIQTFVTTEGKKERVNILLQVSEGKPVIVGENQWKGVASDQFVFLENLKKQLPLQSGTRFTDQKLLKSQEVIYNAFMNNGYPDVAVEYLLKVNSDLLRVDIVWMIAPGTLAYFGKLNIKGNEHIDTSYLKKHIKFKDGEQFSKLKLEQTQRELFELGLFRVLSVKANTDAKTDSLVPITLSVKEAPCWALQAGVGYGTEDRLRISGTLTRLHFFGGARKLILGAKRSYFYPLGLDAKFIQPDIFTRDLDLIINPFYVSQNEYSYDVKRLGAGVTFQRKLSDEAALFLTYSFENDRLTISDQLSGDLSKTESLHDKSGFTAGYTINTTKDIFDPHNGWKWNASLTYMGIGFNSKYHFLKMTVDGRKYIRFLDNWVLASRVNFGFIEPLQGDLVTPLEDRFMLGGASSLRGWGRNEIALKNENGLFIGGNYMAEANLEVRIPIYDIFSGVVFADAGNIWNSALVLPAPRLDAGLGLRAKSPIGPIRLDVGFPFGANKFTPQFFISIGHAF